jgi:hypothetical protein
MAVVATENGGQRVIEFAGGTDELGSPPILHCLLSCSMDKRNLKTIDYVVPLILIKTARSSS